MSYGKTANKLITDYSKMIRMAIVVTMLLLLIQMTSMIISSDESDADI